MRFSLKLTLAIAAFALASCVSTGAGRQVEPLFLKTTQWEGLPMPAIGRTTNGRLSLSAEGCVYLAGVENFLIIWPPDGAYDRQGRTFRTARSGELRFGMNLALSGMPVAGPLKVKKIGGVAVPEKCRRMNVMSVSDDGARRLAEEMSALSP